MHTGAWKDDIAGTAHYKENLELTPRHSHRRPCGPLFTRAELGAQMGTCMQNSPELKKLNLLKNPGNCVGAHGGFGDWWRQSVGAFLFPSSPEYLYALLQNLICAWKSCFAPVFFSPFEIPSMSSRQTHLDTTARATRFPFWGISRESRSII